MLFLVSQGGLQNSALIAICLRLVLVASPLILGYDSTASSNGLLALTKSILGFWLASLLLSNVQMYVG